MCKGRTAAGQSESQTGRETSTTGAQREEAPADLDTDFDAIRKAWTALPQAGRRAILAVTLAFQSGVSHDERKNQRGNEERE